ncbi:unnamed protein product [Rhodiola kirilowii]
MDKAKIAAFGERLKIGGVQMSRMVSEKVKDLLQAPTPESKIVEEATSETMEEPNWGLNMRIFTMINNEEYSGQEIVKAIKKRLSHKSVLTQRFSLELLEACTMNCEKVFSEVASERVLDEMVKLIDNPQTDHNNRNRAMELIRAWGESEDLAYLPVFNQTYMSLMNRGVPLRVEDTSLFPGQQTLESYIDEQPMSAPETYPVPPMGAQSADQFDFAFGDLSPEEKKEVLEVTRNSLDLLSSMQSSESEFKPVKDDLTMSILGKLKESQPALQKIIQSTTDDEGMLFEALNLNDQLQQIIAKYEEPETTDTTRTEEPLLEASVTQATTESKPDNTKTETTSSGDPPKLDAVESTSDSKTRDDAKLN